MLERSERVLHDLLAERHFLRVTAYAGRHVFQQGFIGAPLPAAYRLDVVMRRLFLAVVHCGLSTQSLQALVA